MAENKLDHFGEQIKNTVDQAIREGRILDVEPVWHALGR